MTALYLNPVFKAPSVHKYDTEDYRHVNPQFGGDGALLRLRHNTQQLGMRLVLDGVFNHSGDSHAALTGTIVARGELVTTPNRPGATGTRLVMMARRSTGLAMLACRSWIISRKVW
ncbi:alpha-amylase family glycosyl hydrolase [Shigella flexneri]